MLQGTIYNAVTYNTTKRLKYHHKMVTSLQMYLETSYTLILMPFIRDSKLTSDISPLVFSAYPTEMICKSGQAKALIYVLNI